MQLRIEQGLDSPWKVWNQLGSWLSYPIVRYIFARNGINWGKNWKFYGVPIIQKHRQSFMKFGDGLQLRSTVKSSPLGPSHPVILSTLNKGALLEIGNNFGMNGGAISVAESIRIGDNVVVGTNTIIVDTDFHPSNPYLRKMRPNEGKITPVVIEDNVFIGEKCLILRGVTIEFGSVIGPESVLTRNVPPMSIVIGNPARIMGTL